MQITRGIIPKAQKIVIYGPEGVGKTTFASKFPDAVFIDTEGGSSGFDVARLPAPSSWAALEDEVKSVRDGSTPCKTLVIDTADWAERMATKSVLNAHQWSGIEDANYGKGYQYVCETFAKLVNLLSDVAEHGINVVVTAHAALRKFEQPDELGSYDRWEMKLQSSQKANNCAILKEWADAVIFATYKTYTVNANDAKKAKDVKKKATGARRCMYLTHHPCWDAKNRWGLSDDLDDPFEFDYDIIRPYIERGAAKTQQEPLNDQSEEISKAQYDSEIKANSDAEELNRLRESHINDPAKIPREEAKTAAPKPQTFADAAKEPDVAKARNDDTDALNIPQSLKDLMKADAVDASEIQNIVGAKGYFPYDMPITDYPDDFVDGCLVAAWPQVLASIKSARDSDTIPFN